MAPVGQFRVRVRLFPRDGTEPPSLDALVDTGAGYTVVPRAVFETLGCAPHRVQRVRLADGRVEELGRLVPVDLYLASGGTR
jgi:predicted aspartyl protease